MTTDSPRGPDPLPRPPERLSRRPDPLPRRPEPLQPLIAAVPRWRRPGTRAILALARRPRGLALLRLFAPADQAAAGIVAMGRYDDPLVARPLGWDADAVAQRGRELRRAEGRP